jgi:amidohydrolase
MAFCRRVPAFPLEDGESMLRETASHLSSAKELTPEICDTLYSTMATIRREIHAHPEPGFEEVKTHALLKRVMHDLAGIPAKDMRSCAGTGLVVDIHGSGRIPAAGASSDTIKTIALRADMDALRMTEGNTGLPYRSQNQGVAHLCGHDGHMASLIGAAALIKHRAHLLPSGSRVRLLFQPAEEGPGGAEPMIKEGCLEGVDEVYGYHNWPQFPCGQMHIKAGALMAHPTTFKITINGRGGHASQPHFTIDPVLTAAHVIVGLQSIVSRSIASAQNCVVSCTMVHGGEVDNVIPDSVALSGTIRDLDPTVYETITERMRSIVTGTCAAYGCTSSITFESDYPIVDNHPEQTRIVEGLGRKLLGQDRVTDDGLPVLGAEDFSYYLQKVPGCFFFIGGNQADLDGWARYSAGPNGSRSNCVCHATTYDYNDNLSGIAAVFWVRLVEKRCGVSLYAEAELPMPLPPAPGSSRDETSGARKAPTGPISLAPPAKKARAH